MSRLKHAFVVVALAALVPTSIAAAAHGEEPLTRTQGDEIIRELRQMRVLLERLDSRLQVPSATNSTANRRVAERAQVGLGSTPALGSSSAQLTIVEFTDYECPYCRQFHSTAFRDLKRDYIDSGKARYISRDLPLPMHPHALGAAYAARCAGEQNKFWEMRNALMESTSPLGAEQYSSLADEFQLDMARFDKCMTNTTYKEQVTRDMSDASAANITGTPTFVIGQVSGDKVDGVLILGAMPYAELDTKLKALLHEP